MGNTVFGLTTIDNLDNADLVRVLAQNVIRTTIEVQQDMFLDLSDEEQANFLNHNIASAGHDTVENYIRAMATDFSKDLIEEFKAAIVDEIRDTQFSVSLEVERKLKATTIFADELFA